jgi:hypothetical protein
MTVGGTKNLIAQKIRTRKRNKDKHVLPTKYKVGDLASKKYHAEFAVLNFNI